MKEDALNKIQHEMDENMQNNYVQAVGGFLKSYLNHHPPAVEKILVEGKSIKGSLAAMRKEAEKHKHDGVGILTDAEGFAAVLKYFDIEDKIQTLNQAAAPAAEKSNIATDLSAYLL